VSISVRDVAERAGVSVGTVSNVLNNPDKVSPATAERVQAAITELGFVRNDAARQLRAGHSRSIGMIVLDVRNPFFTDVARGAEASAAEAHLSILLANSDERPEREAGYLDLFEEQRVRGILITPVGDVLPRLEQLRSRGIPCVLVDRLARSEGFSSVSVDDEAGGAMAMAHLADTGRRHVVFVGGPFTLDQVRDREAGARRVARERGVRLDVVESANLSAAEGVQAGRMLADAEERPDAVFAANDVVALGLLQGLIQSGLRVPEDVAIVGYDDIDFAASATVPITSIGQPRDRIGSEAVELLLAEADGTAEPRQIVFDPGLVVRASSAPRH
jgi:LacI family transcriptional regulator